MATYNRPGVYINELPLTAAPITGAAAANAAGAVIAAFSQGPDTVTLVTSWYDFVKTFGGYSAAYPATFSVGSFFKNGGTELYVKRVLPTAAKKVAKVDILSSAQSFSELTIAKVAKTAGTSGVVTITTTATHGLEVGDVVTVSGLTDQVDPAVVFSALNTVDAVITGVDAGARTFTFTKSGSSIVEASTGFGPGKVNGTSGNTVMTVAAKHRGLDGNNIRVEFSASRSVRQAGYYDITVYQEAGVADTVTNGFVTANSGDDLVVEQFSGVVINDPTSGDYITTVLDFNSAYIKVLEGAVTEYDSVGDVIDPVVTYTVDGTSEPLLGTIFPLSGAPSPETALTYLDYTGNSVYDPYAVTGDFDVNDCELFKEFETIEQPLVFFLPDVISKIAGTPNTEVLGWDQAQYVYKAIIEWVESPATSGRNFVIVETSGSSSVDSALNEAGSLTESSRAAVYYPHVYIKDPIGRSGASIRKIGPSGAVAGLYLYSDRQSGPFKAPAGIGTKVVDAIALERAFSASDLDSLNTGVDSSGSTAGNNVINAIRNIPGAGVVVMGGRTLKQDGTANRYVSMRRSLTYIETRLKDIAQFAVFENNTETLWARMITVLGVFLNEYRNQGGLRGTTVDESFYIKCDGENNTAASIQAGEVHVEVGVALEYPAEFVVINLSQKTAE